EVACQRAGVALGRAGAALTAAAQPALAGVFLVPAGLAVLHGLVFPWPRYNVPAMPILLAAAGVFLIRVAAGRPWRHPRARRALLTVVAPALLTLLLAAAVRFALPAPAPVRRLPVLLLLLPVP